MSIKAKFILQDRSPAGAHRGAITVLRLCPHLVVITLLTRIVGSEGQEIISQTATQFSGGHRSIEILLARTIDAPNGSAIQDPITVEEIFEDVKRPLIAKLIA